MRQGAHATTPCGQSQLWLPIFDLRPTFINFTQTKHTHTHTHCVYLIHHMCAHFSPTKYTHYVYEHHMCAHVLQ